MNSQTESGISRGKNMGWALLLVAATASAISQGPGGRLYMTERVEDEFGDYYVSLKSYQVARSYYLKAIILGGDKEKLEEKIDQLKSVEYE